MLSCYLNEVLKVLVHLAIHLLPIFGAVGTDMVQVDQLVVAMAPS